MDEKDAKILKIDKVEGAERKSSIGESSAEELERLPPNKEHFDSLINVNQQPPKAAVVEGAGTASAKNSLMDEVRLLNQRVDRFGKVDPKELVAQVNDVVNQMKTIKGKLATPNLELKPETQTLLQNKLQHIDENLRVALSKAGVEYDPSEQLQNKSVNPIERFLGFLTHSQAGLASLSSDIETMQLNNREITPANMLRIQLKVAYITQEVEFFTAVLNKALDSTKTIMNVQV